MCKKIMYLQNCRCLVKTLYKGFTKSYAYERKNKIKNKKERKKYKQTSHIKRFPSKSISKSKHKRKTRVSFYIKSIGFNKLYKSDFTSRI